MASTGRFDQMDSSVQNELCARIAQLDRDLRYLSVGELCRRAEALRLIAEAHGLNPAERVAADLRRKLEDEGRNLAITPYLDRMCDAIGCERQDQLAAQAHLSSTVPAALTL